jgi:hypothetical protein
MNKFKLEEPVKYQKYHWWHGERLTPEWIEWVSQKSSWNFNMMDDIWDHKICPFVGKSCIRKSCIHFNKGFEYDTSCVININWYGEKMYREHTCKLWRK